MRRAAFLLPVLAWGLTLAACGQQADPTASHEPPLASDDPAFLPLAAYDMPDDDGRTVGTARWTLAKECMVRLGFDGLKDLVTDPPPTWPQRPAGTGAVMFVLFSDALRYGVQDPEQAARYGYQAAQAEYKSRSSKQKWTLPEYLALTGEFTGDDPKTVHGHRIPRRGCLGEADLTIFGGYRQDRKDPVLALESKSIQQGMQDPVWKKADKEWSACMRKVGYDYANHKDAETGSDRQREELAQRLKEPQRDHTEPSAPEKKTATADARCKQQTGYVRTVHAIDVRIQNQLVAKNRTELEEQRRWNRDAARKAHDILDDRS